MVTEGRTVVVPGNGTTVMRVTSAVTTTSTVTLPATVTTPGATVTVTVKGKP